MDNYNIVNESINGIESKDSWVDFKIGESKEFIGRKTMDYSMFVNGTFIPKRYVSKFLENISEEIEIGASIDVKLVFKNCAYKAKINRQKASSGKSKGYRLLYSDKAIYELLTCVLEKSYNYIMNYTSEYGNKPSNIPIEYREYVDFYTGDSLNEFKIGLISVENKEINDIEEEIYENADAKVDELLRVDNINSEIDFIHSYITSKGYNYSKELIQNFYISIKTKPFVILSGISGTGKSKIVELFAEAMGASFKNERFRLVPVKPDWSDSTDLLGYRNIEGKFTPGIITLAAYEAMKNPEKPYFICLDEMNLARVEYYFSDILSLMETRKSDDERIVTEKLLSKEQFGRDERAFGAYGDVYIPENLYIVGTVNMDETTFPFSKKVLDRANTIEFNKVELGYSFEDELTDNVEPRIYHNDFLKAEYLKLAQCRENKETAVAVIDELIKINKILEEYNQHFGFRVRDEIVFYMIYAVKNNIMDFNKALDYCIVQKILPKINGSNGDVLEILIKIFNLLNNSDIDNNGYLEEKELKRIVTVSRESSYKLSSEKLANMIRRFVRDGFTTFWQ